MADEAVLAAIGTVQQSVDSINGRLDGMVTRSELVAEMRGVHARLDRVQESVGAERTERIELVRAEHEERVEHVRAERGKREAEIRATSKEFMEALAAEQSARLSAEAVARARIWKILPLAVGVSAVIVSIIALVIG